MHSRIIKNFLWALELSLVITPSFSFALPISGLVAIRGHHLFRRSHNCAGHHDEFFHQRRESNDHGDVAAHDAAEAWQKTLMTALEHFEEYGDTQSLNTFLRGYDGMPHDGKSSSSSDSVASPAESGNNDQSKGRGNSGSDKSGSKGNAGQGGSTQQPSDESTSPQTQPAPQSNQPEQYNPPPKQQQQQQQPKFQLKKAKTTPPPSESYDPNASKDQGGNGADSSSSDNSRNSGNSGDSINGYIPPSFSTDQAPSTASLYSMSSPFTGRATYYGAGLGACGIINDNNDPIVAISKDVFEQYNPSSNNPNHNSLCGKKVEIEWKGRTVQAFAMDECPECEKHSLDCSPSVFEKLDDKEKGVLDGITCLSDGFEIRDRLI
ncbi:uncharacterized protein MEPE_05396 [Melanopsichium pennsylvanicum]|uniref:RlpA-like protein double-psi beta-barrel domain-containing protein n=2 Tax=Melanopsichium pennsylvanicum TaxID=63383 RepID=A0AAJ5C796_9BASI|nr:uncharacterized protein BN887_04769 [Melanopsichium pennsylvanicum 4]SNX86687.1 uncharacterized protein MEPE_05396 [Melanopsichium pennsylvanicum]